MPKTVVFHVGLPKTGTTTIQKYLRRQDEKLHSFGFLYPGVREHEALHLDRHLLMLNAMKTEAKGSSDGLEAQACRDMAARVFTAFRQSDLKGLIWSCEGMALAAPNWDAGYLEGLLEGLDVRIVCLVRYIDDWVESLVKERLRGRAGPEGDRLASKPLRLAPAAVAAEGAARRPARTMLGRGAKIGEALRTMREILPSADVVVRSYDAGRAAGKVVSDALAAMGLPPGAFPSADEEAGVHNPTKSDLYGMLSYQLVMAGADVEVLRQVAAAAKTRDRQGRAFEPLAGRRYRFLSDENIVLARGFYEELRREYPHLPVQPPHAPEPAERGLGADEAVALLDWLRPDISDATFAKACAACSAEVGG